jgi:hypothetical protein
MKAHFKPILGVALVLLLAGAVFAQDDAVAAIQKRYAQAGEMIAAALKAEREGVGAGLYATEILVNSHSAPWRAVGNYRKKTTFWYTDQPEFAVHEDLPPAGVLLRVDVRIEAAARRENEEYLFDKGRPVFYYHRVQYGDEPAVETRCYFREGRIIRTLEGSRRSEDAAPGAAALRAAEALIGVFLASF